MKPLVGREWPGFYRYKPFVVRTTDFEFWFSRRCETASEGSRKGYKISAVWNNGLQETLVNGVLQGRKHNDPKGASAVSRVLMSQLASEVFRQLGVRYVRSTLCGSEDIPKSLVDRDQVKVGVWSTALKGWIRNQRS